MYTVIVLDAVEKTASDTDSDAEPEAVAFVDSRKNVLDRVRSAIRQIERDRQQVRAKRQKKDTVYKEQKVQKVHVSLNCILSYNTFLVFFHFFAIV